jgi:2-dehydropantoate 2-reductase
MKILIFGAGVIGTTYGWQLAAAGQDVTLLVRLGKIVAYQNGIPIRCKDERTKPAAQIETVFHSKVTETFAPEDGYDLIVVCVKSNQLQDVLPDLARKSGKSDILFFQNNWWGDEKIRAHLSPSQYFFGFSRIVGGWRDGATVESIIFDAPGMSTMLGEKDGQVTPRLQQAEAMLRSARLKPEISQDILSWLKFHYVEYVGASGAILKAGSAKAFADNKERVREAILATREALAVCRARQVPMSAAPFNLKLYGLPLPVLVRLGQQQYQAPNIVSFFDENIRNGLAEIVDQYHEVLEEGRRLGVAMPVLSGLQEYYDRETKN